MLRSMGNFDRATSTIQQVQWTNGSTPSHVLGIVIGGSMAFLVVMLLAAAIERWVRPRSIRRAVRTYLAVGWRRVAIVSATGVGLWRWTSIDAGLYESQSPWFDAPEAVLAQCLVLPVAMVAATDWVVSGFRRATPPSP